MKSCGFKVCNGFLSQQSSADNSSNSVISLESAAWYEWLENHKSFRFESAGGSFTARKECRAGSWYWYAYHRRHGKLFTTYLGKSRNLTLEQLQATALTFNMPSTLFARKLPQKLSARKLKTFQAETLLITKLQVPYLPPLFMPRPALKRRLNAAMQQKLILLSAPAGFGKTTVLSEWASSCSWPVSWVSLDERDNDPVCFWGHLIAALESTQPGAGEHALALLRAQQTTSIEAVITVLVNALSTVSQDFALVLDDYHIITTPAIHQGLLFLLNHLPAGMHLLIASRTDPPLSLPRLRANCHLAELRTSDLRFTSREVEEFFLLITGRELSQESAANLEMLTEGWVAGLQLAAISSQSLPDISIFLKSFAGDDLYIFDYLANEVWLKQPRNIQTFLLKIAIPERVNASLCDALTGQTNGQQMLEQLEKANLFIVRLDNRRRWYRFHHLFQEFLRARLQSLQPEKVKELHLRACEWYEQNNLTNDAIHHALLAGDFLRAATLIISIGQRLVQNNETATLSQWLDAFPEALLTNFPRLCLLKGWLYVTSGQYFASQAWLQRAQEGLENPASLPLRRTPEDLAIIEGELAILRSHLAIFQGDISRSLEWANQALSLLPEDNLFLRSLGELNLGVACWLHDDIKTATRAMIKADLIGQAANNLYVRLMAFCILIHIQMEQAQLDRALQTCEQALQLVAEEKGEAFAATSVIYISMGQLFYLQNDLKAADRLLQEGIALSKRWQHSDLAVYGYTIMAQVKQAQGDALAALRMVQLAKQSIQAGRPCYWIASAMAAIQIQLALVQKNFEVIEQWQQTEMCSYVKIFEQQALAQIALTQGRPDRALTILEQVFQRAEEVGRIGAMIDVRLWQTLAYQQLNETRQALQMLAHALALAEPGGVIRPFLDAGSSVKALLCTLVSDGRLAGASSSSSYLHRLLAAFGCSPDLQAGRKESSPVRRAESQLLEQWHLNRREIEIIRLIATGLSTQAIAQRIILTESTVRWHIKNIYSKLHIHNRAQLVLRAHELGLE